jgi:SET domain-containing protein
MVFMKRPDRKRIEPDGVFVKKSILPGVGKGLFTRRLIARGEKIIEYKGRIVTFKQIQESGVVNPYVYYVNRNHVIDAMPFPDSVGRYVNDAEGPVTKPGCSNNAKFVVNNKRVFFEAITDILPGSEIFVSYGSSYWDTTAFNQLVEKSYGAGHSPGKK